MSPICRIGETIIKHILRLPNELFYLAITLFLLLVKSVILWRYVMLSSYFFSCHIWGNICVCNGAIAASIDAHIHRKQQNFATISRARRLRSHWYGEILLAFYFISRRYDSSHCRWHDRLRYFVLHLLVSCLRIVWSAWVLNIKNLSSCFHPGSISELSFHFLLSLIK